MQCGPCLHSRPGSSNLATPADPDARVRQLIAILICVHTLFLSGLASAHMAVEEHQPYETAHVHFGDIENHEKAHADGHEGDQHVHLCAVAIGGSEFNASCAPAILATAFTVSLKSCTHSPPVPPPNT